MELSPFKKRMDSRCADEQVDVVKKMRNYIACKCARAFADTLEETYTALGFEAETLPELEAYDMHAWFGTDCPQVIVTDSQLAPLDDAAFGEFKLELGSHWKVNAIGLKIEHPEPDVVEAHFLVPADADKVMAAYKELSA